MHWCLTAWTTRLNGTTYKDVLSALKIKTEVKISPVIREDLQNLSHLQPEGWQDILPQFDFYSSVPFCHPFKLVLDRHITGIGCAITFPTSGWLAHIIVDPSFRNRGFGTRITSYLMEWLKINGCSIVQLVATEAGERVYRKLGFKPLLKYHFFSGSHSFNLDPVKIRTYEDKYREEIWQLDRYITGDNRRELLDPHFTSMKLFLDQGKVLGFYAPLLGEGLILAIEKEAGIELLKLKHAKKLLRTVVPEKNLHAIDFFKHPGFQYERSALRMILGESWAWTPENIYSRLGGNLG